MPFILPTLPFPRDANNVPYIASPDDNGNYAVASGNWFKKYDSVSGKYFWAPVSSTDPLPVVEDDVRTKLQSIIGYIDGLETAIGEVSAGPTVNTVLARLKDLADRLGEVSTSPTANTLLARLKNIEGYVDGLETALGTQADAAATENGSLIAILKQVRQLITNVYATLGSTAPTKGLLVAGTDGTNARALKTATDGTVLTQLTGRNVEEITVINALAITDTVLHLVSIDLSKYKTLSFFARSTLDQSCKIWFQHNALLYVWNGSAWEPVSGQAVIPSNNAAYCLNSRWSWYKGEGVGGVIVYVKCDVAPTTGSITVYVRGVPN